MNSTLPDTQTQEGETPAAEVKTEKIIESDIASKDTEKTEITAVSHEKEHQITAQEKIDQALELCNFAQQMWEKGKIDDTLDFTEKQENGLVHPCAPCSGVSACGVHHT